MHYARRAARGFSGSPERSMFRTISSRGDRCRYRAISRSTTHRLPQRSSVPAGKSRSPGDMEAGPAEGLTLAGDPLRRRGGCMRAIRGLSKSTLIIGIVVAVLIAVTSSASGAPERDGPPGLTKHRKADTEEAGETKELMDRASQYAAVRTAPALSVSADAFQAGRGEADALPAAAGAWSEVTNQPYNSDALGYRDPFWSNSSGGAGLVAGRMSAIVSDGNTGYARADRE